MSTKQTAVEWFLSEFEKQICFEFNSELDIWIKELIPKAKEMEKEQIINSRLSVFQDLNKMPYGIEYIGNLGDALEDSEKYYNETYEGDDK